VPQIFNTFWNVQQRRLYVFELPAEGVDIMALSTKRDAIVYLLGALQRLISQVELAPVQWEFVYDLLNTIHKFVEKYGE
jgi:hypothetical protein